MNTPRLSSLLVLTILVCIACSGEKPSEASPQAGSGAAGSGGGAGTGGSMSDGGTDAAVSGFQVSASASKTTLCPGQCTMLSAKAEQGTAPYSYAWDNGVPSGGDPHEVCPTKTTTYAVTAQDASKDVEEFGGKNAPANASVKVTVTDNCNDAGEPIDVPVSGETHEVCQQSWAYDSTSISQFYGWGGNSNIATDADGNLYVSTAYHGTLTVDGHTVTSVGEYDTALIKLSPSCKVLWIKSYGAALAQIWLGSVAVDKDGNLFAAGAMRGTANLGAGAVSSSLFQNSALLVKLDDTGTVLWNKVFTSATLSTEVIDLGVDGQSNVVFTGYAAADSQFGGAPIGGPPGSNVAYIAKLDKNGAHQWSYALENDDYYVPIAVDPTGIIAMSGLATGSVGFNGGAITFNDAHWHRFLVVLEPTGKFRWGTDIETLDDNLGGWWGGAAAFGSKQQIAVDRSVYTADMEGNILTAEEKLASYSITGDERWTKVYSMSLNESGYWNNGIAVDTHDNVVVAREIEGSVDVAGTSIVSKGQGDVVILKVNDAGDALWTYQIGGQFYDWAWGLATGPDDSVWITTNQPSNENDTAGKIVVSKLAP